MVDAAARESPYFAIITLFGLDVGSGDERESPYNTIILCLDLDGGSGGKRERERE
jgi:hypothetical protein